MPAVKKAADAEPKEDALAAFVRPIGAAAKLAYVQTHISNVEKTGQNTHHNYAYMQEHGLIDLLRPYLRLLNCAVVPSPALRLERTGNQVTLIGTLTFIDGDEHPYMTNGDGSPVFDPSGGVVPNPRYSVVGTFAGEGQDNQDKATNKAHTSWMKYALQKFFMVPTEHVDDSDSDDVQAAQAVARKQKDMPAPAVLEEVQATVREAVKDGSLDKNKVGAKLATLRAKKVTDLDVDQMNVFFTWVREQIDAAQPKEG